MLSKIIKTVSDGLISGGVFPVYNAFDNVLLEKKCKGIFTIVEISSFESSSPIYSPYTVFLPFKAEVTIKATAPQDYPIETLYSFYDEKVSPAINKLTGLNGSLKDLSIKYDSNINRLVLSAKLLTSGITRVERNENG